MDHEFFTWGNFFTWLLCSFFIYISLNFRLYMIFHHPGKRLRRRQPKAVEQARKEAAQVCTGEFCPKQM